MVRGRELIQFAMAWNSGALEPPLRLPVGPDRGYQNGYRTNHDRKFEYDPFQEHLPWKHPQNVDFSGQTDVRNPGRQGIL